MKFDTRRQTAHLLSYCHRRQIDLVPADQEDALYLERVCEWEALQEVTREAIHEEEAAALEAALEAALLNAPEVEQAAREAALATELESLDPNASPADDTSRGDVACVIAPTTPPKPSALRHLADLVTVIATEVGDLRGSVEGLQVQKRSLAAVLDGAALPDALEASLTAEAEDWEINSSEASDSPLLGLLRGAESQLALSALTADIPPGCDPFAREAIHEDEIVELPWLRRMCGLSQSEVDEIEEKMATSRQRQPLAAAARNQGQPSASLNATLQLGDWSSWHEHEPPQVGEMSEKDMHAAVSTWIAAHDKLNTARKLAPGVPRKWLANPEEVPSAGLDVGVDNYEDEDNEVVHEGRRVVVNCSSIDDEDDEDVLHSSLRMNDNCDEYNALHDEMVSVITSMKAMDAARDKGRPIDVELYNELCERSSSLLLFFQIRRSAKDLATNAAGDNTALVQEVDALTRGHEERKRECAMMLSRIGRLRAKSVLPHNVLLGQKKLDGLEEVCRRLSAELEANEAKDEELRQLLLERATAAADANAEALLREEAAEKAAEKTRAAAAAVAKERRERASAKAAEKAKAVKGKASGGVKSNGATDGETDTTVSKDAGKSAPPIEAPPVKKSRRRGGVAHKKIKQPAGAAAAAESIAANGGESALEPCASPDAVMSKTGHKDGPPSTPMLPPTVRPYSSRSPPELQLPPSIVDVRASLATNSDEGGVAVQLLLSVRQLVEEAAPLRLLAERKPLLLTPLEGMSATLKLTPTAPTLPDAGVPVLDPKKAACAPGAAATADIDGAAHASQRKAAVKGKRTKKKRNAAGGRGSIAPPPSAPQSMVHPAMGAEPASTVLPPPPAVTVRMSLNVVGDGANALAVAVQLLVTTRPRDEGTPPPRQLAEAEPLSTSATLLCPAVCRLRQSRLPPPAEDLDRIRSQLDFEAVTMKEERAAVTMKEERAGDGHALERQRARAAPLAPVVAPVVAPAMPPRLTLPASLLELRAPAADAPDESASMLSAETVEANSPDGGLFPCRPCCRRAELPAADEGESDDGEHGSTGCLLLKRDDGESGSMARDDGESGSMARLLLKRDDGESGSIARLFPVPQRMLLHSSLLYFNSDKQQARES